MMKVGVGAPVQFAASQRPNWADKLTDDLKIAYQRFNATKQDAAVKVIVVFDDKAVKNAAVMQKVADTGLQIRDNFSEMGMVIGEVPVSKLPRLAGLSEVASVSENRDDYRTQK